MHSNPEDHWTRCLHGRREYAIFKRLLEFTEYKSYGSKDGAKRQIRILQSSLTFISKKFGMASGYCHATFLKRYPYVVCVKATDGREIFAVFETLEEAKIFRESERIENNQHKNDFLLEESLQDRPDKTGCSTADNVKSELFIKISELPEPKFLFSTQAHRVGGTAERTIAFPEIVGADESMCAMERIIADYAMFDETVLIEGETGTGKELLAKALHLLGARWQGPFIPINCGAIQDTLIEAELFGVEKGAFTNASIQRKGKFEKANKGTLFFDEIGELSSEGQTKLLRAIESGVIERVGGNLPIQVDVRIISATNYKLEERVDLKKFRSDLYYRISALQVDIPPLRDRGEDVLMIARFAAEQVAAQFGKQVFGIRKDLTDLLIEHDWPGNMRELFNVLKRAIIDARHGILTVPMMGRVGISHHTLRHSEAKTMLESEKRTIEEALLRNKGNREKTAHDLDIGRATLYRKLKKYKTHKIDTG